MLEQDDFWGTSKSPADAAPCEDNGEDIIHNSLWMTSNMRASGLVLRNHDDLRFFIGSAPID